MFVRASKTLGNRGLLSPLLALGIGALLLVVLQHLSQAVDYRSVMRELRRLTAGEWSAALGATIPDGAPVLVYYGEPDGPQRFDCAPFDKRLLPF